MSFDNINTLPVDNSNISEEDKLLLSSIFKFDKSEKSMIEKIKTPIYMVLLFGLLVSPFVDNILNKITSNVNNKLIIKMILFAIGFYSSKFIC